MVRSTAPALPERPSPAEDPDDAHLRRVCWTALALAEGLGAVRIGRAWRAFDRDVRRMATADFPPDDQAEEVSSDAWGRIRAALSPAGLRDARHHLRAWTARGPAPIHPEDPAYPPLLARTVDPPPLLFVRGRLPVGTAAAPAASRVVAVVGTRTASPWALSFARGVSAELARAGVCVASGLALGVDAAAHTGALAVAPDATVAVLGSSLDRVHPARHQPLAERIARRSALLSEHPPGTNAYPGSFPRRNRIVSGLARAVLMVEGREGSGVRHTVRFANDEGRDVFVVPQRPDGPKGRYAASLLADGATPFVGTAELVAAVSGLAEAAAPHATAPPAGGASQVPDDPAARRLLALLSDGTPRPLDALLPAGTPAGPLLALLTRLELAGLVTPDGRGGWRRA